MARAMAPAIPPALDRAAAPKLANYRAMRDFSRTAEPSGDPALGARIALRASASRADTKALRASASRADPIAREGNSFVIQKHAARRLHYDFRLELDGVLLSWSVPKGPSLSPKQRRLAVRTEDHPLDYASFEGIIPKGQYGGGTVAVWDRGTWEPEGDPREAMQQGRLTFTLHGDKLHGRWHLVRIRSEAGAKHESWLLFKGRDEAADDRADILRDQPASVISGRTLEQIAEDPDPAVPARATSTDELLGLVSRLPLDYPLTNLDRVLYPDQGITKGQLIAYLAVVADWMLPHVANRPLTIVRCPEGHTKPCFFQKHLLDGSPPSIHRLAIEEAAGKIIDYMRIDDMPGLVALAQLGTLEIHTWGSHADRPEQPDLLVFDLDPDAGLGWDRVALAAFHMRRRLSELGLASYVKTTGGKGLHVVAPVERRLGWDDTRAFAKAVALTVVRDEPSLYTTNMAKSRRSGKIFLDYLRNTRGATFIAPYSPRARAGAPVAVPITWEELAHGVDPAAFDTSTVPRRLARLRRDPWDGITTRRQSIKTAAWKAIGGKPP
ncbi:MAG: ATP-dependent ligase [Deltaproteobacteria bacterium]|nr:ATP-dependent ligase [Deltaproteobacteria bacterium]